MVGSNREARLSPLLVMIKRPFQVLALLAVLANSGCGRSDRPTTHPVHGTVTLDGEPVKFGAVRFISEGGRPAMGKIQSDGSYRLGTFEDDDGALPGSYRVSVMVREKGTEETAIQPAFPGPSLIPEGYEDPNTSGLAFEVVEGDNTFDVPLTSR